VKNANEVCCECIRDDYLVSVIQKDNKCGECSFCGKDKSFLITIEDFAEKVHDVLEKQYQQTSEPERSYGFHMGFDELEQDGEPIEVLICDIASVDESIAEAILDYLSTNYDPQGKDALCGGLKYSSDCKYEELSPDTSYYYEEWESCKRDILNKSRFFNSTVSCLLAKLFNTIDKIKPFGTNSVVRELTSKDSIYRARIAKSEKQVRSFLSDVSLELGPPLENASAGRMNAVGISSFYGALDRDTCIAEVRAPVGSFAVIGCFVPRKRLKLLDLPRLQYAWTKEAGSPFDSNHTDLVARVAFLKRIAHEMSLPIMPGEEDIDYIPTQIITEYLASREDLGLDGIIFKSSQINTDDDELGNNVLLFKNSSSVKREKKYFVEDRIMLSDKVDIEYTLTSTNSKKSKGRASKPTLKVDYKKTEVRKITGVKYSTESRTVYVSDR